VQNRRARSVVLAEEVFRIAIDVREPQMDAAALARLHADDFV